MLLSFCILACCDAFLEQILVAKLCQLFLEKKSESEKINANQRMLLQMIVEIFENSNTIVTDGYKHMLTMIKRTNRNDKTFLTSLYNDFSKAGKKKVPDSETIKTTNTLVKASKILRDRQVAQKHLLNADSIDIENFDPYHFILKNCDPMQFNFISSLQGETISNFVQNLE